MNTAHKQKTSCQIIEKELCIIEQHFERSWDAIHQDDVHPYIRNLWITHLFNDQNWIDILKFKEKQINKEIRLHLNKNIAQNVSCRYGYRWWRKFNTKYIENKVTNNNKCDAEDDIPLNILATTLKEYQTNQNTSKKPIFDEQEQASVHTVDHLDYFRSTCENGDKEVNYATSEEKSVYTELSEYIVSNKNHIESMECDRIFDMNETHVVDDEVQELYDVSTLMYCVHCLTSQKVPRTHHSTWYLEMKLCLN